MSRLSVAAGGTFIGGFCLKSAPQYPWILSPGYGKCSLNCFSNDINTVGVLLPLDEYNWTVFKVHFKINCSFHTACRHLLYSEPKQSILF